MKRRDIDYLVSILKFMIVLIAIISVMGFLMFKFGLIGLILTIAIYLGCLHYMTK